MNYFAFVEVLDGTQQVIHNCLNMENFKINATFEYFFQIAFCKLHYHVNRGEFLRISWEANLDELNYARMSQLSKQCHLS